VAQAQALRGTGRGHRPLIVHGDDGVERGDLVEGHHGVGCGLGVAERDLQHPCALSEDRRHLAPDDHVEVERPGGVEEVRGAIGGRRKKE
jgi:hypothetical protein